MKTELTIEESAHLIELGVDPKLASEIKEFDDEVSQWTHRGAPIFTLTDILTILPKEIGDVDNWLDITGDHVDWTVEYEYTCYDGQVDAFDNSCFYSPELIDALYQLLCWTIEKGYYKPKTEGQ